jgi:DNA polymerase-1
MVGIASDTMLVQRLREPEAPAKLGALAWQVGMGGYKEAAKDLSDEDDKGGNSIASLSPNNLHAYGGRDAFTTLLIHREQQARPGKLSHMYDALVGPAFDALAIVERNGILLSEANVRAYDAYLQAHFLRADTSMRSFPEVPAGFSPGSAVQTAALLYDVLKLPCTAKTKGGGRSVAADALVVLKDKHPIIPCLIELAKLRKQISTYGLSMLEHISSLDGRVHTTFKLVRTGRLSSAEPNCQNITRPDEAGDEGEWARGCFVAPPGSKLISLDYGQLELRAAAMLSGDEKMAAAFESGHDFHRMTASAAFKVKPEAVTQTQRQVGKVLNFAIVFGKSAYSIAMETGLRPEEAEALVASLLETYPKLGIWLRTQESNADVKGELFAEWNPPGSRLNWAHRRSLAGIGEIGTSKEADKRRRHYRNVAKNDPIQWLANCFALASLTEAVRWTVEERPEVKVVMVVHDEILFESPDGLVDEVVREGKRIMLSWPSGVVKLKVGAEVGQTWGSMQGYEEKA